MIKPFKIYTRYTYFLRRMDDLFLVKLAIILTFLLGGVLVWVGIRVINNPPLDHKKDDDVGQDDDDLPVE